MTAHESELAEVLAGLREVPPKISPRWFYDEVGSALYTAITRLPEYYPTRAELALLEEHGEGIAAELPVGAALVELGSGSAAKASLLLDRIEDPSAYHPLDVSPTALEATVEEARERFPRLEVRGHAVSFAEPRDLGPLLRSLAQEQALVLYFSGSTISNFTREEATALLSRIAGYVPASTAFLLGIDLIKPVERLLRAYDDPVGVTAAFNRNALAHLNRHLGSDFHPERWEHEAVWNETQARVEMWLRAREPEVISLGAEQFTFPVGARLHTEDSHKWSRPRVEELIAPTPWRLTGWWTDAAEDFGEALLVRDSD